MSDFLIQDNILMKYTGSDSSVVIPEGVTQIGSWAFTDNTNITSIVIPGSVTTIMNHAFSGCTQLKEISIPQSVKVIKDGVFYRCSALEKVNFPHGNISLGDGIFRGCLKMKKLEIPQGMEKINGDSFRGIENLQTIVIPASVRNIASLAFSGSKQVEEYIVSEENENYCSMDGVLFTKNMDKLLACPQTKEGKYVIPESVNTISFAAFYNCDNLTEVVFHNGITEIAGLAFSGCDKLEKADLPSSVKTIGQDAFRGCDLIREVFIPASVSALGESGNDVFGKGVECITVDPANKKYVSIDGMLFTMKGKNIQYCPGGKKGEINLPDKLTNINGAAFAGCSMITAVNIPQSVKKIGISAFRNCSSLKEIVIPEGVKEIKDTAFENCTSLEKVTLPEGIVMIESRAFKGCISLKEITLPQSVYKIGMLTFAENTVVICTPDIFKKLPAENKTSTSLAYLADKSRFTEEQAEAINAYIKKNRADILEKLMTQGTADMMKAYLEGASVTKKLMNECLECAERTGNVEMKAFLLEYNAKK